MLFRGVPTYYTISSFGRIKGIKTKYLTHSVDKDGYETVHIHTYQDSISESYTAKVHRLVAETFIPNPENKPQVNHKDGDKSNNHVSNLEWVTCQENIDHAIKNDMRSVPPQGENHPWTKRSAETINTVCSMLEKQFPLQDISTATGIRVSDISTIKHGNRYRAIIISSEE